MKIQKYNVIVIGAGPAGYEASIKLSNAGFKTLLIEKNRQKIGGVCLNEGCIPSKTYLQSAELFLKTKWYKELGIKLDIKEFNLLKLQTKSEEIKDELRIGISWLLENAGVESIFGEASFISNNKIKIDKKIITFDKCIIASGSVVKKDENLPIDGRYIISSKDVFTLKKLPDSITIIGSGAIACEFATFFNALNVDVTMIIRGEHLLSKYDIDISKALEREFKKRDIKLLNFSKVKKSQIKNNKISLEIENNDTFIHETKIVLLSIGRVANTDNLTLENTEVLRDEKCFIKVNDFFQTNQKNIYAIGDCINTQAFAHVANMEAKIVSNNIINKSKETNKAVIPSVIFSIPQIASCGLSEKEAKNRGFEIVIKKNYLKASAKAKIMGDDSGFIKVIVCAKSDEILGASIIGAEASEIIHNLLFAIENRLKFKKLKRYIFAHPTMSEIISLLD